MGEGQQPPPFYNPRTLLEIIGDGHEDTNLCRFCEQYERIPGKKKPRGMITDCPGFRFHSSGDKQADELRIVRAIIKIRTSSRTRI